MGKKYKLIKKFPGSAPVGTIIDLDDVAFGITCNYTNYPEFWEEIIEKDYERLLYKGNILYIKTSSASTFKNLISPYIIDSMLYKL